jgi:gliding motility-associated-like protein
VELGSDTTICQGASLLLDAGNSGSTFLWSTGATTGSITVQVSGTYAVTVSNGACTATDAIEVGIRSAPTDGLQDVTRCAGETVLLDAANPGSSHLWNTGATTPSLLVNTAGTYTVQVTNSTGCTALFDAVVVLVQPPLVDLGPDTVLCDGEVLLLGAGNPGSTYQWSTGSTAPTLAVRQTGTYSVMVGNGYCQRSDAISVQFNPSPIQMATRQFHTCLGEDQQYVRLDAGNPGSRYDWSTGESSQVILAGAYGWYVVEVLNQFDCAARDSAHVIEYCPSAIFIPNTFTPNGDGTNDIFIPVGKNIATMQLLIFDRWGNLLFETNDPASGWDGTYGGRVVENDIYVWRLSYRFLEDKNGTLGMEQEQLGHVQVLR